MDIIPPPRLYKYQPYNVQTLDNLKDRRIWFSKPIRFNDPFDCSINFAFEKMTGDQWNDYYNELKEIWEKDDDATFKVEYEKYFQGDVLSDELKTGFTLAITKILKSELVYQIQGKGIACFSEKADDILMWSHYSDGHRGFYLEFDTRFEPFSKSLPVKYSETLPILSPRDKTIPPLMILATTKSIGWSYEKEWRAFHEEGDKEFGIDVETLTGVYFGSAMPYVHKEVISLILRDSPTKLYESKISKSEFKVKFQQTQYTPFNYSTEH